MHPLTAGILAWYDENKRDLPWRHTDDPYRVWVSEVMLQQTRVEAVLGKYEAFVRRYPTITALAGASEEEVLAAWQGLGYYVRARRLHAAAKTIGGGAFPAAYREFRSLPGVGEYTANAVFSICFNEPRLACDGNILRVGARLGGLEGDSTKARTRKRITRLMEGYLPRSRPGDFNQALMDLGSGVCTPRTPRCPSCPLETFCTAKREGTVHLLPGKPGPSRPRDVPVHVYWITCTTSCRLLLRRRGHGGFLQGLWELPWIEDPEGRGENGVEWYRRHLDAPRERWTHTYTFSHKRWMMVIGKYVVDDEFQLPPEGRKDDYRWVTGEETGAMGMATVFRAVLGGGPDEHLKPG